MDPYITVLVILGLLIIGLIIWKRPTTIEVNGTKFQSVHVGDLLDEYVTGKIPPDLRLPTGEEWQKWVTRQGDSFSPFQQVRVGKPGVLAGDIKGNLLAVVR